MIGISSPGKSYSFSSSRTSISTSSSSSSSSTMIALVQEYDDVGNANLTGQQDVLAGLGHRAVGSGYNQDSTVHLRSAGDHVLNIVSVAGAVNVSIVTLVGLILNVSGVDRDSACLLFGRLIDLGRNA